jgi:hypothetical protein
MTPIHSAQHPALNLQNRIAPGTVVIVKVADRYRGQSAIVETALTAHGDPAFITGGARYALRMGDNVLRDYCRFEIKRARVAARSGK